MDVVKRTLRNTFHGSNYVKCTKPLIQVRARRYQWYVLHLYHTLNTQHSKLTLDELVMVFRAVSIVMVCFCGTYHSFILQHTFIDSFVSKLLPYSSLKNRFPYQLSQTKLCYVAGVKYNGLNLPQPTNHI
jgi:hypothetical protein